MLARPMGVLGWLMVWARWQLAQAEADEGGVCACGFCVIVIDAAAMARTIPSRAVEVVLGLRGCTGLSFHEVLCQQAFAGGVILAA